MPSLSGPGFVEYTSVKVVKPITEFTIELKSSILILRVRDTMTNCQRSPGLDAMVALAELEMYQCTKGLESRKSE